LRHLLGVVILFATQLLAAPACAATNDAGACAPLEPVRSLALEEIYSDSKGSIPNEAAVEHNGYLTASINLFLRRLEQALDRPGAGPGDPQSRCAAATFHSWGEAGALTLQPVPYSREGAASVNTYLVGINLLALKLRAAGFGLDRTELAWLHKLNRANLATWEKGSNRGNLRIWSAADAALYDLIEQDPDALGYQNQVWREATAAIHDDGSIDGEMARSHRALIYHMFSFSATLVLRSAREALGYRVTPPEHERLQRLADLIGRSLCDPQPLAKLAGATQEMPGEWAFRIPIGYGSDLLSDDWARCGKPHANLSDPTSGGDTRRSAELLVALAPKH
jgi:poly(beta-D-mannuronate) lyase